MRISSKASIKLAGAIVAGLAGSAFGQTYILQPTVYSTDSGPNFSTAVGGGYDGDTTYSYSTANPNDTHQINWDLPAGAPAGLYTVSWWGDDAAATNSWGAIDVQYDQTDGAGGTPNNPWAGQFGTNHQWISDNATGTAGVWNAAGPGPQTSTTPPADGSEVYMQGGNTNFSGQNPSYLYFVWNSGGGPFNESWSDLKVTYVPEPASASLLLLGAGGLFLRRRRMA